MSLKHLKNGTGMSALETVAILTVVSIAALVASNLLKKSNGSSFGGLGMDKKLVEAITEAKDKAGLVVVGKIVEISQKIQESTTSGDKVLRADSRWTLEIESIERGHYSGKNISFYMGWWSNRVILPFLPPGIKKNYKKGDRLRVFLYYGIPGKGNNELSYFSRFSFLGMEPL